MLRTFRLPLLLALFSYGGWLPAQAAEVKMTTKVFKLPITYGEMRRLAGEQPPPTPPVARGNPPAVEAPAMGGDPFVPARPAMGSDPFAPAPAQVGGDPFGSTPGVQLTPLVTSSRQILEAAGVTFPEGASAVFDPVTQELTLHNTPDALDLTAVLLDSLAASWHKPALAFTVTLVQAPGEMIRQANAAASHQADATPQLEALLAEAAKPGSGVQVVGEMLLNTESGTRSTVAAVLERTQPAAAPASAAPADEKKQPEQPLSWTRQDGMSLELEAQLAGDGKTMDITFALNLGPEPPTTDAEDDAGATPAAADRLRRASFTTGMVLTSGSTKLIGITQPPGKDAALKSKNGDKDVLWAAFLTGHARLLKSPPGVVARPGSAKVQPPAGMRAVAFEVPDGLLEMLMHADWSYLRPMSLKGWLEGQGVTFLPGTSIEQRDGMLQAVTTPENLEIIAALVEEAAGKAAHNAAFTLHTFQVPATLLRPLLRHSPKADDTDDSALLAAVEAAAARGEGRVVSSAFFEGKNGVRTRHESGLGHSIATGFGTTPAAGGSVLAFQQQPLGEVVEIEPTVSDSGHRVDFTYMQEIHPGPPTSQRQHLRAAALAKEHDLPAAEAPVLRLLTNTAMASGTTKLISLYQPTFGTRDGGAPEMLWATFVQAHAVPQVPKPQPPPAMPKPTLTPEEAAIKHTQEKMNEIILPVVDFQGVTVAQAVEFFRVKSRELDTSGDAEKGVKFSLPADDFPSEASITLNLLNVPLSEALRYVVELAQMRYKVKPDGVLMTPLHSSGGDELLTRKYHMPPDFLTIGEPPFCGPLDPFSAARAKASDAKTRKTAKQILEGFGITFPEGATASYILSARTLVVRNTEMNLDLVEALNDCRCSLPPATVAFTVQVLQGPGPLLRRIATQAAPLNDHRALLEELLAAVKAGTVRPLDTARVETRSGTRAYAEQGHDATQLSSLTLDGQGGSALKHAPLFSGLRLVLEPTHGADGVSVGLNAVAEFHTAPPLPRQEHLMDDQGRRMDFTLTDTHRARLTTELTLLHGHTRLLYLWKPTGTPELEKEDVLQMLFITCDVLPAGTVE